MLQSWVRTDGDKPRGAAMTKNARAQNLVEETPRRCSNPRAQDGNVPNGCWNVAAVRALDTIRNVWCFDVVQGVLHDVGIPLELQSWFLTDDDKPRGAATTKNARAQNRVRRKRRDGARMRALKTATHRTGAEMSQWYAAVVMSYKASFTRCRKNGRTTAGTYDIHVVRTDRVATCTCKRVTTRHKGW